MAYVKAAKERGRSRWIGSGIALGFELCRTVRQVLTEGTLDVELTRRAGVRDPAGATRWWIFAGLRANTMVGETLGPLRLRRSREENLAIRLVDGVTADDVKGRLGDADAAGNAFPVTDTVVDSLKFSTCLPKALASRTLRERRSDREAVHACLREPIRHVVVGSSSSISSGMASED